MEITGAIAVTTGTTGAVRTIEQECEWVEKSLTPMLAVIVAGKESGGEWLLKVVADGVERWSRRHVDLVRSAQMMQRASQPAWQ